MVKKKSHKKAAVPASILSAETIGELNTAVRALSPDKRGKFSGALVAAAKRITGR